MGPLVPVARIAVDPHQVGRCFDELAEAHELASESGMSTATDQWVARTLEELADPPGMVLIMGCGTGREALPLVAAGWSALMVDVSAEMVARAQQRFSRSPAVTVVRADIEAWLSSFSPPEFDAAIAVGEVISYLPRPEALLKATADALRPGSWLLLTFMDADVLSGRLASTESRPTATGIRLVERRGLAAGELYCQAFSEGVVDRWASSARLIREHCAPPGQPRAGRLFRVPLSTDAGTEVGDHA